MTRQIIALNVQWSIFRNMQNSYTSISRLTEMYLQRDSENVCLYRHGNRGKTQDIGWYNLVHDNGLIISVTAIRRTFQQVIYTTAAIKLKCIMYLKSHSGKLL